MFDAKTIRLAESLRPDLDFSVMGTEQFAILKIVENASGGGVEPIRDAVISNGIAYFDRVSVSQPLVSLKLNIPVTQTGSGTPSPTNIRDFMGVSGVNIGQTSDYGKYFRGLLNGTYGFVDLGSLTWEKIIVPQGTLFRGVLITVRRTSGSSIIPNIICPNFITTSQSGRGEKTISQPTESGNVDIIDSDYTDATTFKTAMSGVYLIYELAKPSTPITPEQFATLCQAFDIIGNTYQITFGQTVYSANLDVLTGKLSITHGIVDLGDLEWNLAPGATRFYTDNINDISLEADFTDMFCSGYNVISSAVSFSNMPDKSIKRGQSNSYISIRDLDYTDASLFTTAVTGMKLVYKLAEPIEIQLTPTVINTLIGENVIFADVADVTECKYTRK